MWVVGATEPLEGGRLGGGADGAGGLQAVQGRVVVGAEAGRQRVNRQKDVEAGGEQVQGGVQHADVRLHAGQHDVGPAGCPQVGEHAGGAATAEGDLCGPVGRQP